MFFFTLSKVVLSPPCITAINRKKQKMFNNTGLGDSIARYVNILRTINETGNSYSIDMQILTDYFNS